MYDTMHDKRKFTIEAGDIGLFIALVPKFYNKVFVFFVDNIEFWFSDFIYIRICLLFVVLSIKISK